jgi:thiol-disulfide isomerase/thioredoxin
MASRRMLIVAVMAVAFLAACGGPARDRSATANDNASHYDASAQPTTTVPKQLDFVADTVDGGTLDARTLAGKDTVLWFWAPWCADCRREAPHVAAAQAKSPNITFVGVAGLGPIKDMKAFVRDYRLGSFKHIADTDGSVWQRFGVVHQPAHAFIDESGDIEVVRGVMGPDELARHLADLKAN